MKLGALGIMCAVPRYSILYDLSLFVHEPLVTIKESINTHFTQMYSETMRRVNHFYEEVRVKMSNKTHQEIAGEFETLEKRRLTCPLNLRTPLHSLQELIAILRLNLS